MRGDSILMTDTDRDQRRDLLDELFEEEQILAPVGTPKTHLEEATLHGQTTPLAKLQKALRPDEMILEYVLDEPSSFCLHITRASAGVCILPAGRKHIEDLTDTYLDAVRLRKRTATKASGELFSILLDSMLG
jgi:hypothetical protein